MTDTLPQIREDIAPDLSVERLLEITPDDINRRVADFHRLVNFEQDLA